MKIAREGYPLIVTAAVVTILPFALGWVGIGVILGLCTIAIAGFFRDPERTIPTGDGLIVSPADGKVVSIVDIKGDPRFTEATARVSIFLSPLDVHINRSPVTGKIEQANYQRGKFFAAYKDEASARNEQNTLKLVDERGRRLGVVQVAGVVARRIICRVQRGEH